MPLYKSINVDEETHILIWEITETEDELMHNMSLKEASRKRLKNMSSPTHRKGFLSVRQLLLIAQYTDEDLIYNENGKPFLEDGVHVSITHSHQYVGVIFSAKPVGIDIEKQRDKIVKIGSKFLNEKEERFLFNSEHEVEMLTFLWCAKEAVYKLYGEKGLSFKNHIEVGEFDRNSLQTSACVNYNERINFYDLNGLKFNGFTCVFIN